MREIPLKKRMEVLGLYFEGLSYDEISRKAKVSKGSVVNVVIKIVPNRSFYCSTHLKKF